MVKNISHKNTKLVLVKVDDKYNNFSIKNYSFSGTYLMETDGKELNNWKVKIPNGNYEIIGESHYLTEQQIKELGMDLKQYINLMSEHEITYNYSKWDGKWIVLLKK